MEDRRAHERIAHIESKLTEHLESHARFEASLDQLVANTAELVQLVRGAKGLRSFIIWAAPIAAAFAAGWAWIKGH